MSRRKRQPEQFDVVEFLRESDGDLKSALNSLLRNPAVQAGQAEDEDTITPGPGLKLVPAPARSEGDLIADLNLIPGPDLMPATTDPGVNLRPGPELRLERNPLTETQTPDTNLRPGLVLPSVELTSEPREPKKRRFPIREMKFAQDAHTRAEQQVYEYLWQNAKPLDEVSRTITIGFGTMARMVRLSESNARINVRNLIAKLAMQEFGDYDCERSVGRTYRIFNYSEILKRRREAGLLWYMRRTLAVVFVNPSDGQPLDIGIKKQQSDNSGPGTNITPGGGLNLSPEPPVNLSGEPGLNLEPLYREEYREKSLRETSSSHSLLFEALSHYGVVDDDVLTRLRSQTRKVCPDFTDEELLHFIHSKGHLIRSRDSGIASPMGFLLASVPKCFVGESFQLFRKAQIEAREREAAERSQREAELQTWRREQQAILDDPNTSEEDKRWARKVLSPDENL